MEKKFTWTKYALLGEYVYLGLFFLFPLTFTPLPLEMYVKDEPTKLEFLEIIYIICIYLVLHVTFGTDIQIIIKVFSLIKYFLSNKNLTSPILTLDAN